MTKGRTERVYYIRDNKNIITRKDGTPSRGNPVACIASVINRATGEIKYSVSAVHRKDTFVKTRGRTIAIGRLNTDPISFVTEIPSTGHAITHYVMEDILTQHSLPQSVVAGARRWLEQASRLRSERTTDAAPPSAEALAHVSVPANSVCSSLAEELRTFETPVYIGRPRAARA